MMTSNVGSREMSVQAIGFGDAHYDTESKGKKAIEKFFNPEFRNRLDAIINFNPLTVEIMEKVVDKFIDELFSCDFNQFFISLKYCFFIFLHWNNSIIKTGIFFLHSPNKFFSIHRLEDPDRW